MGEILWHLLPPPSPSSSSKSPLPASLKGSQGSPSVVWRCTYAGGVRIRTTPEVNGAMTGDTVKDGEIFQVSEERKDDDGMIYLKLADNRGWVIERRSDLGVVCVRHDPWGAG